MSDFIGRDVLIIIALPAIEGTVTATRISDKTGQLWLTVTDKNDENHDVTLGDVIFL